MNAPRTARTVAWGIHFGSWIREYTVIWRDMKFSWTLLWCPAFSWNVPTSYLLDVYFSFREISSLLYPPVINSTSKTSIFLPEYTRPHERSVHEWTAFSCFSQLNLHISHCSLSMGAIWPDYVTTQQCFRLCSPAWLYHLPLNRFSSCAVRPHITCPTSGLQDMQLTLWRLTTYIYNLQTLRFKYLLNKYNYLYFLLAAHSPFFFLSLFKMPFIS